MKLEKPVLLLILFLLFALPVAEAAENTAPPEPDFEIKAKAALLMETNSGKIIWEKIAGKALSGQPDQDHEPAPGDGASGRGDSIT